MHCHEEAQRHIARIINVASARWGVRRVFVEGAFATVDVSILRTLPASLRRRTTDGLLREGILTGPEMAAVERRNSWLTYGELSPLQLTGLEDPATYWQHLLTYQRAQALEHPALNALNSLRTMQQELRVPSSDPLARQLTRINSLVQLQLTPYDYAEYLKARRSNPLSPELTPAILNAEAYYRWAKRRDAVMLKKAEAQTVANAPTVLVIGGFHAAGISEMLRREGKSFAVLAPTITELGPQDLYKARMQNLIGTLAVFKFLDTSNTVRSFAPLLRFKLRGLKSVIAQHPAIRIARRELPSHYHSWNFLRAHQNLRWSDWLWRGLGIGWMLLWVPFAHTVLERFTLHHFPSVTTYVLYAAAGIASYMAGRRGGRGMWAAPFVWASILGHASYNAVASIAGLPSLTLPETELSPAPRSFIFSENADAIDAALLEKTRGEGRSYLRVTLRDDTDLDRLMTTVWLDEKGALHTRPGKLPEIISHGGTLLIDYNESDPKLVEGFNSLFDRDPYFGLTPAASDLRIVGVMNDSRFSNYPGSFYSRFETVQSMELPSKNLLQDLRAPPDDVQGVTAELYESPQVFATLIGHFSLGTDGHIQWNDGALTQAVRENRPLVLRGGDWQSTDLALFIRQVLLKKEIEANGQTLTLPADFKIYKADADYQDGVTGKTILLPSENSSANESWVINRETQDALFAITHVNAAGQLTQQTGLLERPVLRLRMTEALPDWVWHRIMHAPGQIEIDVQPGVPVPAAYRQWRSTAFKNAVPAVTHKLWEDVAAAPVVTLQGDDLSFMEAEVRRRFAGQSVVVTYPVTPETTLEQLIASIEFETAPTGERVFHSKGKGFMQALRDGKIVVLKGLESNPSLQLKLQTATLEHPYLMENGQRIPLDSLSGKLFLLSKPQTHGITVGENTVLMPPEDAEIAALLAAEFPHRFHAKDWDRIRALRDIFETLPAPETPGLYPDRMNFSYARLRLLYQFDNWLEAFDHVVISSYESDPKAAAFLRTNVRLAFSVDEAGRRPHTLHGRRLTQVLNRLGPTTPWTERTWELADTLSLDDLKALNLGTNYSHPNSGPLILTIQEALIKNSSGERQEFYRDLFHNTGDVANAPFIDNDTVVGEPTWQEQRERILKIFQVTRAVMLKGSPGTGKSFITEDIAHELGYPADDVIGPVTTGADVREADLVSRRGIDEGRTTEFDEAVAQWAKRPNGALLVVDEANLTDPAFWNFLQGLFAEKPYVWINGQIHELNPARHRVIFTGNQETLAGRQFQDLIQNDMVTVNFHPFDDAFLHNRINDYLSSTKTRRSELVDLVLQLHKLFLKMEPSVGFSLRDIQELSARINLFDSADWTKERVIALAWQQYQGNFDPEQRLALEFMIANTFGVVVRDQEKAAIAQTKASWLTATAGSKSITLVDPVISMMNDAEQFMAMRQARLQGKSLLQGKRGMIFEGPSGRGKDLVLAATLQELGLVDAKNATADTPPKKRYHHLNASLNYDEMVRTIRQAQQEGSVVILSEMNLLPSALLEGKLNDLLTGKAAEGFAFFATMNSTDFSGREKLSTALMNRVIYQRLQDYSESDLLEIAQASHDSTLSEEDLQVAVKAHLWIRDQITDASFRPTTRDLLHVLQRGGASSIERAINEVYGPLYLTRILRQSSAPSRSALLAYRTTKNMDHFFDMIKHLAGMIIPAERGPIQIHVHGAGSHRAAAFYNPKDNSITLSVDGIESGDWEESLLHEASHGAFTRTTATHSRDALYQDLEDLRHLNAFTHYYPASGMNVPSANEKRLQALIQRGDVDGLIAWMTSDDNMSLRKLFQYSLTIYARGLVTQREMGAYAAAVQTFLPINPFQRVLPNLELAREIREAIPLSQDEMEIQFQQYRALARVQKIRPDFLRIPDETFVPQARTTEDQAAKVKQTLEHVGELKFTPRSHADPVATVPASSMAPVDIAQNKLALVKKLEQARQKDVADVTGELDLIRSDLAAREGVTLDRRQEIENQLTNEADLSQLLIKIHQLNDKKINREVDALKQKLAENSNLNRKPSRLSIVTNFLTMEVRLTTALYLFIPLTLVLISGRGIFEWMTHRDAMMTIPHKLALSWNPSWIFWIGGAIAILIGAGVLVGKRSHWTPGAFSSGSEKGGPFSENDRPAIGPRRRGQGAHSSYDIQDIERVAIHSSKPVRSSVRLGAAEIKPRDSRLASLSQTYGNELALSLNDFVRRQQQAGHVYGSEGTLHVERFLTGDPATAFVHSGGREEETLKDIVIQGKWPVSDLLATEVLQYLFARGFRVTVYTSPTTYVEGIATVDDLRKILSQRGASVAPPNIQKDLIHRKGKHQFEITSIGVLTRQVEAVYLYGAFQQVMQKESSAPASSAASKEPSAPQGELPFDQQVAAAEQFLRNARLPIHLLKVDYSRDALELDLHETGITTLAGLEGLTHLTRLNLSGTNIDDLSVLRHLTGLKRFEMETQNIEKESLDLSPLKDLPHLEHLNLNNNRNIRDASPIFACRSLRILDLGYATGLSPDLSGIENLSELRELTLDGWKIPILDPIKPLKKLTSLSLAHASIGPISPILDLPAIRKLDFESMTLGPNPLPGNVQKSLKLFYLALSSSLEINARTPVDLQMTNINGELITSRTIAEYLNRPLSFDEQVTQIKLLAEKFPDDTIGYDIHRDTQFLKVVLHGHAVSNLEFLGKFTAIKELVLENTSIMDLAPLQRLHQLDVLSIDSSDISDLSPIAALKHIRILDLRNNPGLRDITPLKALQNLETLRIQDCPIDEFDGLFELPKLFSMTFKIAHAPTLNALDYTDRFFELLLNSATRLHLSIRSQVIGTEDLELKDVPESLRNAPRDLTHAEQRMILESLAPKAEDVQWDSGSGVFNVDFGDAVLGPNEMKHLHGLTELGTLKLRRGTPVTDLSFLNRSPRLRSLSLSIGGEGENERRAIKTLLETHPNNKFLTVRAFQTAESATPILLTYSAQKLPQLAAASPAPEIRPVMKPQEWAPPVLKIGSGNVALATEQLDHALLSSVANFWIVLDPETNTFEVVTVSPDEGTHESISKVINASPLPGLTRWWNLSEDSPRTMDDQWDDYFRRLDQDPRRDELQFLSHKVKMSYPQFINSIKNEMRPSSLEKAVQKLSDLLWSYNQPEAYRILHRDADHPEIELLVEHLTPSFIHRLQDGNLDFELSPSMPYITSINVQGKSDVVDFETLLRQFPNLKRVQGAAPSNGVDQEEELQALLDDPTHSNVEIDYTPENRPTKTLRSKHSNPQTLKPGEETAAVGMAIKQADDFLSRIIDGLSYWIIRNPVDNTFEIVTISRTDEAHEAVTGLNAYSLPGMVRWWDITHNFPDLSDPWIAFMKQLENNPQRDKLRFVSRGTWTSYQEFINEVGESAREESPTDRGIKSLTSLLRAHNQPEDAVRPMGPLKNPDGIFLSLLQLSESFMKLLQEGGFYSALNGVTDIDIGGWHIGILNYRELFLQFRDLKYVHGASARNGIGETMLQDILDLEHAVFRNLEIHYTDLNGLTKILRSNLKYLEPESSTGWSIGRVERAIANLVSHPTDDGGPTISENDKAFLQSILNELRDPKSAISAVRQRFEQDGREALFDSMLRALTPPTGPFSATPASYGSRQLAKSA